jgi:hypothetical protein
MVREKHIVYRSTLIKNLDSKFFPLNVNLTSLKCSHVPPRMLCVGLPPVGTTVLKNRQSHIKSRFSVDKLVMKVTYFLDPHHRKVKLER